MPQIGSKTLFLDSRDSVDSFSYLGGAPRTNSDGATSLSKRVAGDHFRPKIDFSDKSRVWAENRHQRPSLGAM